MTISRSNQGKMTIAWAVLLLALLPAAAWGAAEVVVQVEGGATGLTATLMGAAGEELVGRDDDGDGTVVLTPAAAGEYELEVVADGESATGRVEVPDSGLVTVTWRPASAGEKLLVAYGGFADEELVVTARRREENLQETPISITLFTEEALEARNLKSLRGVGDFSPNVTFTRSGISGGGSNEAVVYIRGIGSLGTGVFQDPGVGIYVDGVYLARSQGSVTELLDLERVEILRGPQGTLFGKNTIGGAISLVTRKPSDKFDAEITLTGGDLDRRDLSFRLNGALSENVYGSLAALGASRDGYARSLATGRDFNGEDRVAARGALRFLPADDLVIDLSFDYTQDDTEGLDQILLGFADPRGFADFYSQVVASAGYPAYDERWVTGNLFESHSGADIYHNGDVYGANLMISKNFGNINLTSISAFRGLEFDNSEDRDGAPFAFVDAANQQEQDQFSQELQISGLGANGRLSWIVGGLYFSEDSRDAGVVHIFENLFPALEAAPGAIFAFPPEFRFLCDPGPPPPGFPCFGGAGNPFNFFFAGTGFDTVTAQKTDSFAVFGQATYDVSKRLSLTFGARFTLDEKDLAIDRINLPFDAVISLQNDDDWSAVSPKVGVEWQARDDFLLYGSVSWGFKSGGFNGITQSAGDLPAFNEENLLAYELGFKSDWLDRRLRLNAAFFFNDYTDIQFAASRVDDMGNADFPIQNAGEAESKGFELELDARPNSRFSLTAGIGFLDTEYTDLRDLDQGTASLDGEFPKSPDWTISLSPQYIFEAGDYDVVARVDYSYRGRVFHDIGNHPLVTQKPFDLVNARVSFGPKSDRWEIAFFGTNLTDEAYLQQGIFIFGFGPAMGIPGRPREWGVSGSWRF